MVLVALHANSTPTGALRAGPFWHALLGPGDSATLPLCLQPLAQKVAGMESTSISASFKSIGYGLALCTLAGISGAVAAVIGKIAGLPDVELPIRIAAYVLLIAVSFCCFQ